MLINRNQPGDGGELRTRRRLRIGIDLGGTKIEGAALDDTGAIRIRRRIPTPAGDYEATIMAVAGLIAVIERELGQGGPSNDGPGNDGLGNDGTRASVGIGIPGTISPATGLVKNANSTCLNGRPLQRDLERVLGRPVRFANDANCFALSEAGDGAAAGLSTVFGVILGTGVGGGLCIEGRSLLGANAIAGEWGHNPLPWPGSDELPGPACYCGRSGCIETFLSGPGLAADLQRASARHLPAPEIVAAARAGDADCRAALDRYVDRLARGLATVINLVDPAAIVLGGGLSALDLLYEAVPRRWVRYVFSDSIATRLLPPMHGDSSGVRGAAWLWPVA